MEFLSEKKKCFQENEDSSIAGRTTVVVVSMAVMVVMVYGISLGVNGNRTKKHRT